MDISKTEINNMLSDSEYPRLFYCRSRYCYWGRVYVPDDINYGDIYRCESCGKEYHVKKPKSVIYYTDEPVFCSECGHSPCVCGYTIVKPLPKYMNRGYIVYNKSFSFHSLMGIKSLDWYINGERNQLPPVENGIQITFKQNRIYDKLQMAIINILRSVATGHHPPYKGDNGKYRTSDLGYVIFDIPKRQIGYSFREEEYLFEIMDDFSLLPLKFNIPHEGLMDEHRYNFSYERSSHIQEFLNIYIEQTGMETLAEPVDMGKITDNWRWDGIIWKELFEFKYLSKGIRIRNWGEYIPNCRPRNTTDSFIIRYIEEEGYLKTNILTDGFWMPHRVNVYGSKHFKNNDENYHRWKRLVDDGDALEQYATARLNRLEANYSGSENRTRKYYEDKLVDYIVSNRQDKCIRCGGKIHNPKAFKSLLKNLEAFEEYKNVGVLCCNCYYAFEKKGLFKEHKRISEKLGFE